MDTPEHATGRGVERDDVVGRWTVHDAIDHQRRGLELLERARLEDPLQLEVLHVVRRNLRQGTVALTEHVAGDVVHSRTWPPTVTAVATMAVVTIAVNPLILVSSPALQRRQIGDEIGHFLRVELVPYRTASETPWGS